MQKTVKIISYTIIATFLGQVLNFFTDVLIANYFGTSWKADAYLLALTFPTIFCDLFIVGINAVFIPLYVRCQKTGDSPSYFSTFISGTGVVSLFLSVVLFFIAPYFVDIIGRGFPSEAKQLTTMLTRMLLFLVITMPISTVLSNLLNAHRYFVIPALGKAFHFTGIILSIIFLMDFFNIFSLAGGFLIGSILFLAVQILILRKLDIKYSPALYKRYPLLKETGVLLLPILLASLTNYINIFIERSVAASFSEGSIASLNYAFKVLNIPVNIFIIGTMTVLLPIFSKYAANGDMLRLKEITLKGLRFITFLMLPVIAGMIILRVPLIKLLFERGEFTIQSTEVTATALLFYAFGIIGLSVVTLLAKVFYALKDLKLLSTIGVSMIALNIVLMLVLSKQLGFVGIPLTFTITYTVHMIVMMVVLDQRRGLNLIKPFLKGFLKHFLATGIMVMVCMLIVRGMDTFHFSSTSGQIILLFLISITGAICYVSAAVLLKIKEIHFVFEETKSIRKILLAGQEGGSAF